MRHAVILLKVFSIYLLCYMCIPYVHWHGDIWIYSTQSNQMTESSSWISNGPFANSLLCCLQCWLLINNPFALINAFKYFPLTTATLSWWLVLYSTYNCGDRFKHLPLKNQTRPKCKRRLDLGSRAFYISKEAQLGCLFFFFLTVFTAVKNRSSNLGGNRWRENSHGENIYLSTLVKCS